VKAAAFAVRPEREKRERSHIGGSAAWPTAQALDQAKLIPLFGLWDQV